MTDYKKVAPDFKGITEQLFSLKENEKIEDGFAAETHLEWLESALGMTGKIAFPELNVPDEVSLFIDQLYEYVQKNHIQ